MSAFLLPLSKQLEAFSALGPRWKDPEAILTVLMITGGNRVQRAISQLAGVTVFTPIAFSFGWVAYSFTAVMVAFGNSRLMSMPDCDCTIVDAKSGRTSNNKSWTLEILGRLMHDYEPPAGAEGALTITFFRVSAGKSFGSGRWDWVFWTSTAIIVVQFGVACIPGFLSSNWMVLILFAGGTFLAQLCSQLPQWRSQKWNARPSTGKRTVVCLTRGNGSQTALVLISEPNVGLRFEDLAGAPEGHEKLTRAATIMLATLWILHLIAARSLSSDGWYILAVGALGMIQNTIAADAKRSPSALGLPVEETTSVTEKTVFRTLQEADNFEPGVGLALLDVFFPGRLRDAEEVWREARKKEVREMKDKIG
ncbi:hypothetical protein B0H19DRAFT_520487 [Mycena capillaripes]|nr:hypothetical protein B0H19DRAFT_520487 [Mycena capillaripes]